MLTMAGEGMHINAVVRGAMLAMALWGNGMHSAAADEVLADTVVDAGKHAVIATFGAGETGMRSFEISAALTGNRNSNGLGKACWRMEWCDSAGRVVRRVELRWGNECLGDPLDRRFLRVTVDSVAPGGECHALLSRDFFDGVDLYGGFNTLSVDDASGGMSVWVGNDLEYHVGDCAPVNGCATVRTGGNRKLKIRYAAHDFTPDPALALLSGWTEEEVTAYLADKTLDGIEGKWRFLDRDNDARWARPGGSYTLAVVRSRCAVQAGAADGFEGRTPSYDILYLGGGKVNAAAWHPCMIKGRLYPTVFENHYDLEWYDAYMEPMGEEVSATMTDGGVVLSFDFPLFHSRLRFSRIPR